MSETKMGWKEYSIMFAVVCIILSIIFVMSHQDNDDIPEGIGTGENEFWTKTTDHPIWAVDAVQTQPVLIFTHSTDCTACKTQTEICESINAMYSAEIKYYDFISGVDAEASECFSAYDPNGPPSYIPLTTILTKGPNNTIIWHSWEGVVEEEVLSAWVQDAIYYYEQYGGM